MYTIRNRVIQILPRVPNSLPSLRNSVAFDAPFAYLGLGYTQHIVLVLFAGQSAEESASIDAISVN